MKRCPYCAEKIQDEARKCKHCGSMLAGSGAETLGSVKTIPNPDAQARLEQAGQQYDTLDAAVTQGRGATVLVGQYHIVKKLGEGGMGVVYLAEDREMGNRPVAVKVLPPLLARNLRAVENLRKEAMVAINLTHPNIIRLYGFHADGDLKFLVMEYIDGQTLEERILHSERGRLSVEDVLPIAEQVAAALDYAHSRKPPVFHRDLKPLNVMIDKDGAVKLLDFGIAREMKDSYTSVTGKQDTPGTLLYMSPEQIRGKRPTAAMDIYSLGVVCYECLNGRPPFHTGELTYQILHESPEPLEGVSSAVNRTLGHALAKDASARPATAGDLMRMLAGEAPPMRFPSDLIEVPGAECVSLDGLADGSREAQERQHNAVVRSMFPLEVETHITHILFRLIPAGSFTMGEPADDKGPDEFAPQHEVTLTRAFYCAKYQITQEKWESVMGDNPSDFKNDGKEAPVTRVSWEDCQAFLKKVCQMEGVPEGTYRLLTEAEWEYSCRAGAASAFCFGDNDADLDLCGWYAHNSGDMTHPVGQKKPNAWDLYDMHGNVAEWCQDWAGLYPDWPVENPRGPSSGYNRLCRGGGWCSEAEDCKSSERSWDRPYRRLISVGLRVARTAPFYA